MPVSRSANRGTEARPRGPGASGEPTHSYRALILIAVLAVLAVVILALPAALFTRFLPPAVHAQDFSGSLWHGSAGKITVQGQDAGALEWRVHPAALLRLTAAVDLHWVDLGFVIDGSAQTDAHGFTAREIKGGGPIEDLRLLGVPAGWAGTARIRIHEVRGQFADHAVNLLAAVGEIQVAHVSSPQLAGGADVGSYVLRFGDAAISSEGEVVAELSDTGGPLQVQAVIHFVAKEHRGMLVGTVKERPALPAELRSQIDNLARLRGRDAEGRVPLELEFTL